jgi:hypothetical protein
MRYWSRGIGVTGVEHTSHSTYTAAGAPHMLLPALLPVILWGSPVEMLLIIPSYRLSLVSMTNILHYQNLILMFSLKENEEAS